MFCKKNLIILKISLLGYLKHFMIRCRHYPPVTTLPDLTVLDVPVDPSAANGRSHGLCGDDEGLGNQALCTTKNQSVRWLASVTFNHFLALKPRWNYCKIPLFVLHFSLSPTPPSAHTHVINVFTFSYSFSHVHSLFSLFLPGPFMIVRSTSLHIKI